MPPTELYKGVTANGAVDACRLLGRAPYVRDLLVKEILEDTMRHAIASPR